MTSAQSLSAVCNAIPRLVCVSWGIPPPAVADVRNGILRRSHDFTAWIENKLRDVIRRFEGLCICVKMFTCVESECLRMC